MLINTTNGIGAAMRTNMRLHCVWMRYWPYNVRFAELIKGALLCTFRSTARASLASPYGRGGRAQRVPEGETNPGKHLASPFDVPREHPLPLPLGEVAERSEDGEGKQCPYPKTTPKEIIIQKKAATPSQSPAVTALPKGEPRGCTTLHNTSA